MKQYPSRKAIKRVMDKVRATTARGMTGLSFESMCFGLNRLLRGWTEYFRYGASSKTFGYLGDLIWRRVGRWLQQKHRGQTWKWVLRSYRAPEWATDEVALFHVEKVSTRRWLYRGTRIPTPWGGDAATEVR